MPSLVVNYIPNSGAVLLVSGNLFSGHFSPLGGIQIRAWSQNSGSCYIGLSGGNPPLSGGFLTIMSGGMVLSGGCRSGMLDGVELAKGDSYFIPRSATGPSGFINVFCVHDATCSGQARIFFEVM